MFQLKTHLCIIVPTRLSEKHALNLNRIKKFRNLYVRNELLTFNILLHTKAASKLIFIFLLHTNNLKEYY